MNSVVIGIVFTATARALRLPAVALIASGPLSDPLLETRRPMVPA